MSDLRTPKPVDFSKPPPAAGKQRLPLPTGHIVAVDKAQLGEGSQNRLTPVEEELLAAAGYRSGDPIPDLSGTSLGAKLAVQIRNVKHEAANPADTPLPPDTPPLVPPVPVPIESLPASQQQHVYRTVGELEELELELDKARKEKQEVAQTTPLTQVPGLAEAFAASKQGAHMNIMDDVSDPAIGGGGFDPTAPLPQPSKVAAAFDPTIGAAATPVVPPPAPVQPTPPPQAVQPPQPPQPPTASADPQQFTTQPAETPSTVNDDTNPGLPAICPRCHQDLNAPLVVPTDHDKLQYLQCILGGLRFSKDYPLFGNRVTITFQTPLPIEADMILDQLDVDVRDGRILYPAHYMRIFENYRFTAAIKEIHTVGSGTITLQTLSALPIPENAVSPLPSLYDYLMRKSFATDTLRKTAMQQWRFFEALVNFMEAKADDADFFSGVAEPA